MQVIMIRRLLSLIIFPPGSLVSTIKTIGEFSGNVVARLHTLPTEPLHEEDKFSIMTHFNAKPGVIQVLVTPQTIFTETADSNTTKKLREEV